MGKSLPVSARWLDELEHRLHLLCRRMSQPRAMGASSPTPEYTPPRPGFLGEIPPNPCLGLKESGNIYMERKSMAKPKDFVGLFMPLQGDLLALILAMGVPPHAADDVLQNAASTILQKIETFELGSNFRAWAFAIAKNHALHALRHQARKPLLLSDQACADISRLIESEAQAEPFRLKALSVCVEKLQERARDLVKLRYHENLSVKAIAQKLNRPVESIFTTLSRIRKSLLDCVRRFEQTEAGPV